MLDSLHALALAGTTLVIVRGTIFERLRRLYPALLECSQCVGMWVGAVAGAGGIVQSGHGRAINTFIVGAATSAMSLLADALLLKLLGDPSEKERSDP